MPTFEAGFYSQGLACVERDFGRYSAKLARKNICEKGSVFTDLQLKAIGRSRLNSLFTSHLHSPPPCHKGG